MSQDYIAFDPSDLPAPAELDTLGAWIDSVVGNGQECAADSATDKISELLGWASGKFGDTVDENSMWSCWPPCLLAEGRYCTFNLCPSADSMTFMMLLSDQCKRLGLVMIDPSGRNPFITVPTGGGLLD
ncbi:MAG: hypothetical protein WBD31_12930 [Rubripirellula sp.]